MEIPDKLTWEEAKPNSSIKTIQTGYSVGIQWYVCTNFRLLDVAHEDGGVWINFSGNGQQLNIAIDPDEAEEIAMRILAVAEFVREVSNGNS